MQHSSRRRCTWLVAVALMAGAQTGCSAWSLTDVPDPSTIIDPSVVETEAGAISLYQTAVSRFNGAFAGGNSFISVASFVSAAGAAGDEIYSGNVEFALRTLGYDRPTSGIQAGSAEEPWSGMHRTRLQIDQALGALKTYGSTAPRSHVAQLYALRGYLSVMFGELFCSGIPFSRAVFGGDIVLGRPLTTEQVFTQAVADFDSALAVSTDSVRMHQFATVGKARALANLNRIDEAATLVRDIPTTYRYDVKFGPTFQNYVADANLRVVDRLGGNGLDYLSAGTSGDFRVATVNSPSFRPVPAKFGGGTGPIPVADGLEARLIEAESKLRAEQIQDWANILNTLRQSAGSQSLPALPADSTIDASKPLREAVMFRERAFWLFGTGRRFGDMRRLIRQYNRSFMTVFPQGQHPNVSFDPKVFSDNPNLAPPREELENNPYFKGCINREA